MKIMFVDCGLNSKKWAIKENGTIIIRGTSPSLEEVRAHQNAQNVEWVKIDARYGRGMAEAAAVLFDWELVRHKLGCIEIEQAVGDA